MELVKSTIRHPVVSRLWGISIWVILTFAITLGSYKQIIDTLNDDVKIIKDNVGVLTTDMAVVKDRLNIYIKWL